MNYISDILYWISTGLLVPDIVLLIFFFGRSLLLIGSFFGQYLSIRRTASLIGRELDGLTPQTVATLAERLPKKNPSLLVVYLNRLLEARDNAPLRQRLLADFEIEADRDLATSKTLSKMGPMLGLMGTLIPMGPALVGLSTGDIASMAYNMQVVFATTVVGLVVGLSAGLLGGVAFAGERAPPQLDGVQPGGAVLGRAQSDQGAVVEQRVALAGERGGGLLADGVVRLEQRVPVDGGAELVQHVLAVGGEEGALVHQAVHRLVEDAHGAVGEVAAAGEGHALVGGQP